MNDEIKEILEQLEWYKKIGEKDIMFPEHLLTNKKVFLLLDYITNLQQENYELNRMCELYGKSLYYAELKDYKSRCEKAVEYIKHCPEYLWANVNTEVLLNILQNRSDKE